MQRIKAATTKASGYCNSANFGFIVEPYRLDINKRFVEAQGQ